MKRGIIIGVAGIAIIVALILTGVLPVPHSKVNTFLPIIITGEGNKTTDLFEVTTQNWNITWHYIPNHLDNVAFNFMVFREGQTDIVESKYFADADGSIISHAGPGEYYIWLSCLNVQGWSIVIMPA